MSETKKVSVSDFSEEIYHVVKCPYCDEYAETHDDPSYQEEILCDHCDNWITIINN